MSDVPSALAPYRLRLNFPYLVGVYLGVNAIPGAVLLVDGPDCVWLKAQHVWGRHDLGSTLLDAAGEHRILYSGSDGRRGPGPRPALDLLERRRASDLVIVTSLPATAFPAGLAAKVPTAVPEMSATPPAPPSAAELAQAEPERRWLHLPGRSLEGDWLTGYAALLETLATELELDPGDPAPDAVAIVGHLHDRNEAAEQANVAELERLLQLSGLRLVSTWLSGRGRAHLAAIGQARNIVSLPYGRQAARVLSRRTGAQLVELDLPLGLGGTSAWLRAVGRAAGATAGVERTIRQELAVVVPRLAPVVGRWLLDRRFFLGQDPFMASGLVGLLEELGGEVEGGIVPALPTHAAELTTRVRLDPARFLFQPREHELEAALAAVTSDLCVSNGELVRLWPGRSVELGFPSPHHHTLLERPYLGFRGTVGLVERLLDELARPSPGPSRPSEPPGR